MTEQSANADQAVARVADGVSRIDRDEWDGCTGVENPFVSHGFLSALEQSNSVGAGTGWQAFPIVIERSGEGIVGALPAYIKGHSQGEYVFDQGWAHAFEQAGGDYYPKLQIASPFSPVSGPRLLTQNPETALHLIAAAEAVVQQNDLSSAHATFIEEGEVALFEQAGWLIRTGTQYHWTNDGYASFEDFLAALSARKRKTIKRERREAVQGLTIRHIEGRNIGAAEWDVFWTFYQDTGARKWGRPYLTRSFFTLLSEKMADRLLLIMAERDGVPIAGALNLIGGDTLYGRYWGAVEDVPFLHFELCYYQAIDIAIQRGLKRVEAGAQGEHKLARGYRPASTWSAHFIADPDFRRAVNDFLVRERQAVEADAAFLDTMTPFKREG